MLARRHEQDGVTVFEIDEARLDAAKAPELRQTLLDAVDAGAQSFVLDLTRVEFMDSSALGALISTVKRLGPLGALHIAGAAGSVEKLFAITRMDRVFRIFPTRDAAIAAAQA
ncbi:STAS domain-containing protein [Fuscibacter oryzae]|uniref:Anti-sigma factor antagonist n=1 Tax=Fuscibacter oryzae TaxID=2803939 RepID=A0A8J7MQW2_9RHOB|nr:STAS domain-containing protein [Fuscibacter oryzae]MBL4928518.1 STAS domain-containing protein [Fuscibacter oryzae]